MLPAVRQLLRSFARFQNLQVGTEVAPSAAGPGFRLQIRRISILPLSICFCAVLFLTKARAQFSPPDGTATHSISGQFIIMGGPVSSLASSPAIANDASLVRLEPALLSISAERIKGLLRRELGISPDAPWQGKIYLVLHPAVSTDEDVTIVSQPFADGEWSYRVQLPDVLSQTRFLRAITGVLLLEMANRNAAGGRSAEIPAWLTDGLALEPPAAASPELILSTPPKVEDGLPVSRTVETQRGLDSLANVHHVLRDQGTLTFQQLSWPTDAQAAGDDGGVFHANAQLFVSELLNLKNGPACLCAMLADMSECYNWQTAFQNSFRNWFPQPLDVEKWWALEVVGFVAHDPGPRWTPAVSRQRLDEILSVPVDVWTASNSLPDHAEISWQAVIRNFEPPQRTEILQVKLRDIELAELRMAAPLVALCDGYRRALADFLGQQVSPTSTQPLGRRPVAAVKAGDARTTLKKLDALDAQLRAAEAQIKPDVLVP
jgi:hypothetical protein